MSKLEPTRTYSNPTATDVLRRMLDERGVEWEAPTSFDGTARYDTVAGGYWFHEFNGKITIHGLDPEQAIAATLGRGVLSASQVSNAVYAHSIHADCADADWQAIADELNATLGSCNCSNNERTSAACKPTTYDNGYSADRVEPGEYYEFWEPACACGNCGELIPMRKFCPNCGHRLEVDA